MGRLATPGDRGPIMARPKPEAKQANPRVNALVGRFKPCDRCGYAHDGGPIARAKYKIGVRGGSFYLCYHHFKENELDFIACKYVISEVQ